MEDLTVEQRVENYFSTINSMARRIIVDTATVRKSNEAQWRTLPYEQQCQLIMDSFVKAGVGEKYSYYPHSKPDVESFPKLCIRSGEKYVIDYVFDEKKQTTKETGHTWRDEHSGPFTWETQSQLNLSITENSIKEENPRKEPPLPSNPPPAGKFNKAGCVKVLPSQKYFKKQNGTRFEKSGKDVVEGNPSSRVAPTAPSLKPDAVIEKVEPQSVTSSVKLTKKSIRKPVAIVEVPPPSVPEVEKPLPKPAVLSQPLEVVQNNGDGLSSMLNDATFTVDLSPSNDPNIPKTGFDFLDDW